MYKITVAMSGGVDSSAALKYLTEKYPKAEFTGVTLRLFDNETTGLTDCKTCCSLEDAKNAANVAAKLNIPHYVYNFKDIFKTEVIDKFCRVYIGGETPNPCVDCNNRIKFKNLLERSESLGGDFLATGHYARIEKYKNGEYALKKALHLPKDQSYVLYGIPREKLGKILFPLGKKDKPTVREDMKEAGFENHNKPDSQDICFVPDGDYADFIRRNTENFTEQIGDFLNSNGEFLAKHKGFINYTIGQRRGLGEAFGFPAYVVKKDKSTGNVYVGAERELYKSECFGRRVNSLSDELDSVIYNNEKIVCMAKTRYKAVEVACEVTRYDNQNLMIKFEKPVRALTSGQHIVFYIDDRVIGGGEIWY